MKNVVISIISFILIFVCNAPAYSYSLNQDNNLVNVNFISLNFSMDSQNGLVIEANKVPSGKEKNLLADYSIEMSAGIASGLLGAFLLGSIGLLIGSSYPKPSAGINLAPGLFMLLGSFTGYTIGSSIGVYTAGQIIGESGNYWLTLLGGFLASLLSLIFGNIFKLNLSDKFPIFIVLYTLLSAGGSVLAYNLSKENSTP